MEWGVGVVVRMTDEEEEKGNGKDEREDE